MNYPRLYRMYDDNGVLLYVGISLNWPGRMQQHRADKPWWPEVSRVTLESHQSMAAAGTAEVEAILTEYPVYNIAGRPFGALQGDTLRTFVESYPCVQHLLNHVELIAEQHPNLTFEQVWREPYDLQARVYRALDNPWVDTPERAQRWAQICAWANLPASATDWPDEAYKDGRADVVLETTAVLNRLSSVPSPLRTYEAIELARQILMDGIAARFPREA